MLAYVSPYIGPTKVTLLNFISLFLLVVISIRFSLEQSDLPIVKTEPFHIDLYHKFSSGADFVPRGSILVRPKTEYRPAQATIISQNELNALDIKSLGSMADDQDLDASAYHLRAVTRKKKSVSPEKVSETIIKSCSLYSSNFNDFLTINLNVLNEFISVNLYTSDPECTNPPPEDAISSKFNTTLLVESSPLGPQPDTATYIKRLEEERQNKLKEGKEDNRSFLAKYWIYIVPGVILLMILGGPDQGAR